MALTEVYVDPSIAADSGTGTIGDPYGDLEYAIEQETFDTSNGTRVNIKAGTDEVLAADLSTALADVSVSVAWVPTEASPLIFEGYTAAAGDGGIGGVSGGGSVGVLVDSTQSYVSFINLHLHNTGAANVLDLDNYCNIIGCEIDNTTTIGVSIDISWVVRDCYIHNCGTYGISASGAGIAEFNYLANGANKFNWAILTNSNGTVRRNIVTIDGASVGIYASQNSQVDNNSVFSNGGTGAGIEVVDNAYVVSITNNLIEGFSGSGGRGIDIAGTGAGVIYYGGNSVYNCETEYAAPALGWTGYTAGGNEILTGSPFNNGASGDFSPVDTGSVKEGSLPQVIGGGLV